MVEGDCVIDGCPGTGARITLDWADTAGAITGKLLPTGNVKDTIEIDGKKYVVSMVDAANAVIFIRAAALGMTGTESPQEIEGNTALMATIEKIRGRGAVLMGLVDKPEDAAGKSPYNPFFAIISPPAAYRTISGTPVTADDCDIVSRLLFMLRMHKTYPVSGTVCTGAAARIPGSIVWETLREEAKSRLTIRIGHPGGIIPVEADAEVVGGEVKLKKVGVYRTARRIMDGYVYVRKAVFNQ